MKLLAVVFAAIGGLLRKLTTKENKTKPMQHAFHVEIEGIAPLIQNNPAKALDDMAKNKKTRKTAAETPTEEWRFKVYHDENKSLGHPCEAIEYALQEAAKSFKAKGRGSMKTAVRQTCFADGELMKITNRNEPDEVTRFTTRTTTGQMTPSYLPVFAAGWHMEFILVLTEDEILSVGHLKEILDYCGARIGIGVHRPKYGRFMVVKFEEIEVPQKRAA